MAGPALLILPIALVGAGLAAAAASAKKKQQQAESGTAPTSQGAAAGTASGAAAQAAGTTAQPAPGTGASALPADVETLIWAAMTSQNPETMRRVADQIAARFPMQASDLRAAAATIEAAQHAAAAAAAAAAGATAAAPPAAGPTGATAAAPPAAAPPAAAPPAAAPPAQQPPLAQMPQGTPVPTPSGQDPARVRAQKLALALSTAKKGTSSEPRALVQEFQLAERLNQSDGSYGSETALALADRYGIVPPKPLYWGKKGADYQTLVKDKNAYKAHLLNLAASDPQRGDEWRSAAKV